MSAKLVALGAPAGLEITTERVPLPPVSPLAAYQALAERYGRDQVYLLESVAGPAVDRRHSFVGFGELLCVSVTGTRVRLTGVPGLVSALASQLAGVVDPDSGRLTSGLWPLLRRVHGAFAAADPSAGFLAFFGYEAVAHIERLHGLLVDDAELPDVILVLHAGCVRIDHVAGTAELVLHHGPHWEPPESTEVVASVLARPVLGGPVPAVPPSWVRVGSISERAYHHAVRRCLRHIAVGDIYQVQIGQELRIHSEAAPLDVYRRLRARNPSPYSYLVPLAGHTAIGASPELFVRVSGGRGGTVAMRPIAGTLPVRDGRGDALAADPKEIAEHVMLVDLCRNDIGRICRANTLDVPEMLAVERFSRVLHLVSTVVGRVDAAADAFDVIAALFPAGTMTGAPKIRAIEIIQSVEADRRGLYSGAIGLLGLDGSLNMALCIRSLVHRDGRYTTRASAGIVEASTPDREWAETLAKLSPAHWAVTGEELLR